MEIYCQAESNRNWKQLSKLHHDLLQHTFSCFACRTEGDSKHRTSIHRFDWPTEQYLQGWLTPYDSMPLWILHRGRCRHTYVECVSVIDIHWAETLPCETLDSPEESTCEAAHPAAGHKMLSSLFDPFPQKPTKGASPTAQEMISFFLILRVIDSSFHWKKWS